MTYQDPDPTPPNGTPRPTPCAAFRCGMFAPSPHRYCSKHHDTLSPFANVCEFAEAWLNQTADIEHEPDRLALAFFDDVLNTLHSIVSAHRIGDAQWSHNEHQHAYRLLGWVECDTCGDFTPADEINVNGMCPHCEDEAAHAL